MNSYEKNKQHINELLEISLKVDDFEKFVLMRPFYCIETRDLNGFVRPNLYFSMEAIYDYYRNNPSSRIDLLLYNTLIYISGRYKGESVIEQVLNIVQYQLDSEKKQLAPFKIDCQSVLNELKKTIIKNKEMYMQPKEVRGYIPFWNNIENYDLELQKMYGHKVL